MGLGNPGVQYEKTRHNAGFLFVDHLSERHGARWSTSSQFQGEVAGLSLEKGRLELLKPKTFMNKSGLSVGRFLNYYKIKPEEMLVVHDELELMEGAVRLKYSGGHAGHNGLRDIIAHLDTRDFYRLRVGIGRPLTGKSVADYVLSKASLEGFVRQMELFSEVENQLRLIIDGDVGGFNVLFAE